MSRVIPIALAELDAAGTAKPCLNLRLARGDQFVVGLTSAPQDVILPPGSLTQYGEDMAGVYLAWPGITPTEIVQSAGLAMANLEVKFGQDDTYMNRPDVLQGLWNDARYHLFRCDWGKPEAGVDQRLKGNLGDIDLSRLEFQAELLDLLNRLNQGIGEYTSKTCRVRVGSQGDKMCNVDIGPFTHSGNLTGVLDAKRVQDDARTEPDGYFDAGLFRFDSGDLAGISFKVKTFAGGLFTFEPPNFSFAAIGDAYTAVAGCDGTRETCRNKFNNVPNMQAEPDLPGTDYLTSPP